MLVRVLDTRRVRFPTGAGTTQPFVRYRDLLHSYHRAIAAGMADAAFTSMVLELDEAVARVDGHGFRATPFRRDGCVSDALGFSDTGGVWVKDETGNVAGSHKGRHLMGVLLHLEVSERLGLAHPAHRPDLAIASCGNAALAAAVLARATGRRIRVFVPVDADPGIVARLQELDANVVVCRRERDATGDPTYARLRDALAGGAIPFTCQGSENGLVIEGGETLGYEMVSDLTAEHQTIDHLVLQVGGGALASACIQSLQESVELGVLEHLPAIHTVQPSGGHPLERAYQRLNRLLPSAATPADVANALQVAATRRSAFMWPWEQEPKSVATGILDDETYDWRAVVGGMLESGGRPLVVSEQRLIRAHQLGHAAGYPVCPTGSAGLAGVLELVDDGRIGPDDRVAVLFTGVQRENALSAPTVH